MARKRNYDCNELHAIYEEMTEGKSPYFVLKEIQENVTNDVWNQLVADAATELFMDDFEREEATFEEMTEYFSYKTILETMYHTATTDTWADILTDLDKKWKTGCF